jgi:hypothetical protein
MGERRKLGRPGVGCPSLSVQAGSLGKSGESTLRRDDECVARHTKRLILSFQEKPLSFSLDETVP